MIALQRLSKKCLFRQYLWDVSRPNSNPNLNRDIISREWRRLKDAKTQECKERAAISIVLAVFSYLAKIGCEDIEEKIWMMVKREHYDEEPSFQNIRLSNVSETDGEDEPES